MDATVIVPCRRAGRHAPLMAAQLRAQTFGGEWEAIFVDDADPDLAEWRGVVERAGFRRLTSLGRGVSAARNTALDAARGDVVLFVDVDDEIAPDFVERMVAAASGVDFAWGDAEIVPEGGVPWSSRAEAARPADGTVLEGDAIRDFVWRRCFGYRLRDLFNAALPGGLWRRCGRELGSVCWRAFRREVVGGLRFVEGLGNGEDSVFLCAYARKSKTMRLLGQTGYRYFMRADGSLARENAGARKVMSKFALRDARRALDPGMRFWRGTWLVSAIEVLRLAGPSVAARYLAGSGARAAGSAAAKRGAGRRRNAASVGVVK